MIRFSKIWVEFTTIAMIIVLIFILGIAGLLAQTAQDGVVTEDKSSSDATKGDGLFGTGMTSLEIGLFLGGIGAFLAGIAALIHRRRPDPQELSNQLMMLTSEIISRLLKNGQTTEFSQVEKVIRNVERNPGASFVERATVDAYRLQQNGRIGDARQMWRAIADYAERRDNDLAKRAGVSIGYLLPERKETLVSHSKPPNLRLPYDSEVSMYRNLGEYASEGVVVGAVLRYFNDPKFEKFSTVQEHNVGSDSYRRIDIALLDRSGRLAAIVECKRIGYVGKEWLAQLTEYCRLGDAQFGLFAADTDPSKWTFLKIIENEITEINRSEFETEVVSK